jgi:hypothetical protein
MISHPGRVRNEIRDYRTCFAFNPISTRRRIASERLGISVSLRRQSSTRRTTSGDHLVPIWTPIPVGAPSCRSVKMAHPNRNIGFFAMVAGSLLAAAVLMALLVVGEIPGPKVAFNASPPKTAR